MIISQQVIDFINNASSNSGVYKMFDANNQIVYIGKAKNIKKRLLSYLNFPNLSIKTQRLMHSVQFIQTQETKTEIEALILESELIKLYKPKFNILLKDDKSFPFVKITNDTFPQVFKYRKSKRNIELTNKNIKHHQNSESSFNNELLFGPFISSIFVDNLIDLISKLFQLRTCFNSFFKTRQRPCLRYDIKLCSAPCVGKISQSEYKINVENSKKILTGNYKIKDIEKKMKQESDLMNYEKAMFYRNQLEILKQCEAYTSLDISIDGNLDFLIYISDNNIASIALFSFKDKVLYSENIYCADIKGSFNYKSGSDDKNTTNTNINENDNNTYNNETTKNNNSHLNKKDFKEVSSINETDDIKSEVIKNFLINHYISSDATTIVMKEYFYDFENIKEYLTIKMNQNIIFKLADTQEFSNTYQMLYKKALLVFNKKQKEFDLNLLSKVLNNHNIYNKDLENIEVCDNSHLFGTHSFGAIVRINNLGIEKNFLYDFLLSEKTITNDSHKTFKQYISDDYLMMKKLLLKRFTEKYPLPDIFIIDGGVGQLHAAVKALKILEFEYLTNLDLFIDKNKRQLKIISISKDEKRISKFIHFCNNTTIELKKAEEITLVTRLIEHAHNAVISKHRYSRDKKMIRSELDNIKNIGKLKQKKLLDKFKNINNISLATFQELTECGLNNKDAQAVINWFNK